MLSIADKKGGAAFSVRHSRPFVDCCNVCGLIDPGVIGPKYTWYRNSLSERLDRGLINSEWNLKFPFTKIQHLRRIYSDHRPILTFYEQNNGVRLPKPFKFLAPWLGHEIFLNFLKGAWSTNGDLPIKLLHLGPRLRRWNKNVFGDVFQRKKDLIKRLEDIEQRVDDDPDVREKAEENQIRLELEKTLWDEELIWIHKARNKWVLEGDRNTKYYHNAAMRRRAFNKVSRIKDAGGNWIDDDEQILDIAKNYFGDLFSLSEEVRRSPTLLQV
ncbi:hypothetical protein LINPERHAP2_LOCUS36270 [Linum perenne]